MCAHKIIFKALYIRKTCISVIVQFFFEYSLINVDGVFWQRVVKGVYVDVQGKFRNIPQ